MPSLHRPLAPWVSSAMLDRLLGPSHLPSDAGAYWCAVRPQAVLAPLAGRASPRCSVVHGHAEPIDRPPVRHAASCATSVLDPGASAPPHHLSLVGGARRDLPHCGAEQTAVVRGDRCTAHVSAAQPHRAAGRGGGAPGPGSRSCGTRRLRPDRSAPRSAQRRASPLREASPHTLDFTGGDKEVKATSRK